MKRDFRIFRERLLGSGLRLSLWLLSMQHVHLFVRFVYVANHLLRQRSYRRNFSAVGYHVTLAAIGPIHRFCFSMQRKCNAEQQTM